MKKLIDEIKDLNRITTKIKNKEKFKLNLTITLPLLNFMKTNNLITNEVKNMIITNDTFNIKELKYIKFTDFYNASEKIDEYLTSLTDESFKFLPEDIDTQSIEFILYEILLNVYKHSKFNNAYLQFINHTENQKIDICIFDNGIGIPGSFKEALIDSENDCNAIFDAINGKTSDKEKYGLHGRGLNSTAQITTSGFDGEMIIASGTGICIVTKEGVKSYFNNHEIHGTFVILRIKNKKVNDIYKYLEHKHINKVDEND